MSLKLLKKIVGTEFAIDVDFIDESVKMLNLPKKSKILDVGTGLGIMSSILALNDYQVLTGEPEDFDYYEESGHEHDHGHNHDHDHEFFSFDWREIVNKMGVMDKIEFQNLNVLDLDFSPESFDAIFLYDTFQHVKEIKKGILECLRVVKNDGLVCIIEANEKAVNYNNENYDYGMKLIDPREYLNDDVSIKVLEGSNANLFILKKMN
jgi:ubiquinone/menaquinone biosynthesis C-methylase UbiE